MQKLPFTLLVDDDPTTNYINSKLLEQLAITDQILVAQDGQEALDMLFAHSQEATPEFPALLFLDVNMPKMNGIEFLGDYQQLPLAHQKAVVIVMLTTSLHPQDVLRANHRSVAHFLIKPLTREKVNHVLQTYFTRNEIAK